MDSSDRFARTFTGLKSVVLLITMAGLALANRSASHGPALTLTVSSKTISTEDHLTVEIAGPPRASGHLTLTADFNSAVDETAFQLDGNGHATVSFRPRYTGSIDVGASIAGGGSAKPVSVMVMEGARVPGSSILVFGPRAGSEVGQQVYVRGNAKPSAFVRISPAHADAVSLKSDITGEWGAVLNLKPGAENITVSDPESGAKLTIPVTVQ